MAMDAWPPSPCTKCFRLGSPEEVADTAMRFVGMALAPVAVDEHHRGLEPMVPPEEIKKIKGGAAWRAETATALYRLMCNHANRA